MAAAMGLGPVRDPVVVRTTRSCLVRAAIALTPFVFATHCALADEGGVSFWLPGTFGSLAAAPQRPGFSFSITNYYTDLSAGGDVARAREFQNGRIPANVFVTLSGKVLARPVDVGLVNSTYVFADSVLAGQAAVSLTGLYGHSTTSLAGTLKGTITTPFGTVPFTRSDSFKDSASGFGDLYPQISLRWNKGVHNFMTYIMGDVPVGDYRSTRLSNIGIGHGAIDSGGGYTYFNPLTGHEFSAVLGATYNFVNPSTHYQNGVDLHLDWGASQFLSKQLFVGLVGYVYKQIGCDRGSGDRVGCFQSQVVGVGPQVGFLFPVGNMQGYLGVKAYGEFAAEHRPDGWNAWVTFAITPGEPGAPSSSMPRFTKG